ncbi:hypothetical protein [Alteribacter natronophilus]|uniref:hypothetical protein n=1 Tax=Alteribacter natronophilus TaxID=2583810 RepID=UPI00110F1220|nr:hypothetical protein [Alteribacter natronophilus]TMW71133.1 hypothetical protein FGB90_14310 [Alteribacter natronophilus]
MKPAILGGACALAAAAVLGVLSYFTPIGLANFLLFLIVLIALAFIPLIVKVFTRKDMPKPQIYGTSAPGKFTTISREEGNEDESSGSTVAGTTAAGIVLLIVFFAGAVIVLS